MEECGEGRQFMAGGLLRFVLHAKRDQDGHVYKADLPEFIIAAAAALLL